MDHHGRDAEASAVTPSLFLGEDHPLSDMSTNDPAFAVEYIRAGMTVCVPDPQCAYAVLGLLGVPLDDAYTKVDRALGGTPEYELETL